MRRLSWPASRLVVQSPKGRTLVNFDTNFFTRNTAATTRVVSLLGQRVTIAASPTAYTWVFGDKTSTTTTTPGAAYPRLLVTHRYLRRGHYLPRVDTTYGGRYRVGRGPWIPISGTVTVTGATARLEAVTATPLLTNPYG